MMLCGARTKYNEIVVEDDDHDKGEKTKYYHKVASRQRKIERHT